MMKMKLFPATLRDQAKDWFLKLGKEFTSANMADDVACVVQCSGVLTY